MKISMWILAEWFSGYSIRADIRQGDAVISGVRFFSDELEGIDRGTLYAGRASDIFFGAEHRDCVLLAHGNDMLFVHGQSLEAVLNRILAAFDFYNAWESSLWDALSGRDTLQKMIDLSEEVFSGPVSMSSVDGKILAHSRKYPADSMDERWRYVWETQTVPLQTTSAPIISASGETLSEWTAEPQIYWLDYGYHYTALHLMQEGEIVTTVFYQEHKKKLTQADCQLFGVFCSIVKSAISARGDERVQAAAGILEDALNGREVPAALRQQLERRIGSRPWVLLSMRNVPSDVNLARQKQLLTALRGLDDGAVSCIHEQSVVVLVAEAKLAEFLEAMRAVVWLEYYAVGLSMPFSELDALPSRFQQTLFAIGQGGGCGVFNTEDFAFEYLLGSLRGICSELGLSHPGLERLKNYDSRNGTELYASLYTYLRNERSIVPSARELFIHRNSFNYRLRRIEELIGSDLSDHRERAYALLSYLVEEDL